MFVFYPKEYEKDNVLSTGDGTEVYGGVEGVDLREERFVGLITTDENIDEIKEIFQTNGLDTKKILTHEQFLEYCRRSFSKHSGRGY